MSSSRELVYSTLEFRNSERAPREMWVLPWAKIHYPDQVMKINDRYPNDITGVSIPGFISAEGFQIREGDPKGNPYEEGIYEDLWGCQFVNMQCGIIGEVKEPLLKDEEWKDAEDFVFPEAALNIDKDKVNSFCRESDKFVMPGDIIRPFERLQFLRGTEALYIDLALEAGGLHRFIERIHDFYCCIATAWAETDVDSLLILDDWGSQQSLLVNPELWKKIFKPLYKEYAYIAHKHGKKIFMHSDGYILDIIPDLIEIGIDALNSQLFCMDFEKLKAFRGKITFWGEIDRQYLLPDGSIDDIENVVREIKEGLWQDGGCIAQCEFGPGAKPENVEAVFKTWDGLS